MMFYWKTFKSIYSNPKVKWVGSFLFLVLLAIHLTILPATILGPEIGFQSFQFINRQIAIFAVLFALFESTLIILWWSLLRNKSHCKTAPAAGGVLIGLISPLLCCTPILPTFLSFVAVLFPSLVTAIGFKIQYTVNVYQTQLLIFALLLLGVALIQNLHYLTKNRVYLNEQNVN